IWIAAESRFPKAIRDHRHIGALFFLRQKRPSTNGTHPEDVEPIRSCFESRHLEGIADSGHGLGNSVFAGKSVEDGLAIAKMVEARCRNRKIDRLLLETAEDMERARRFFEWKTAQEKIVDQAKNGGVEANPEREGDQCEEREPRGLDQLP